MYSFSYLFLGTLIAVEVWCQTGRNPCRDLDINCNSWARNGLCFTHGQLMRQRCPKACQFCEDIPHTRKTIAKPDFDCGRPYANGREGLRRRVVRQSSPRAQVGAGPQHDNTDLPRPRVQNVSVEDTICGATVIHPRFLVTAAHCVLDPERPVRSVRLGERDFSRDDEPNSQPADYQIEKIIVHPYFDPNLVERYNDVALLQTTTPIEFNELVYPFCISPSRPPPKTVVTAAGFGKVNQTSQSPVLQEGELNIISSSECEESYHQNGLGSFLRERYPNLLQGSDVMCAGHPNRGACEGDGGGPLFRDESNGLRFLVGVVSVAVRCQGGDFSKLPGAYISVADHIDFIDSVIYGF